jgi:HSP90 family molecular chaperone
MNRRDQRNEPFWGELIKTLGPAIKDFLTVTAENNKRMTDALERSASAENGMLESISELVEHFKTGSKAINSAHRRNKSGKARNPHHQEVKKIILKMREKGETFERIVEHLEKKGIPTFTGRGKWHAQTVHRLYQEYEAS